MEGWVGGGGCVKRKRKGKKEIEIKRKCTKRKGMVK